MFLGASCERVLFCIDFVEERMKVVLPKNEKITPVDTRQGVTCVFYS